MKYTLSQWRMIIQNEVEFVDVKPYSHNIISTALRGISDGFGDAKANKAIEDFGLEELGWKKSKQ